MIYKFEVAICKRETKNENETFFLLFLSFFVAATDINSQQSIYHGK